MLRSRLFNAPAALALALGLCAAATFEARAQGAASVPARAAPATADLYSCPMHPEVKSKKAGSCPKCRMTLRPVKDDAGASAAGDAAGAKMNDAHATSSKLNVPDVELIDQDGRKVRFYTDLLKGKVVAVQFIFTTCTTICPPLGATFARVQREMGERAGRDVHFISISVDPATDTPERMKAWGEKFKAGPGWTLVTGAKPQVDEVLRALGASASSPADHTPAVLVGNDAKNQWTRAYGLARPSVLVKLLDDAAAGRLEPPANTDPKETAP